MTDATDDGTTVVVVDDHAMLRDSVSRALETAGHEVVGGAGTPEEALSLVRIHEPGLLLADVNLGDGNDGITLAAEAMEVLPGLKVVVVSMHDDERTVKRALEAGVAGFVSKDAPLSELLEGVATVVGVVVPLAAAGGEGDGPAERARDQRSGVADRPRGGDPRAARRRCTGVGDRRVAVPRREDGEEPPDVGVREARRQLRRPGRRRGPPAGSRAADLTPRHRFPDRPLSPTVRPAIDTAPQA